MEALKEAAKTAASETAAAYGWGMVVLVTVLVGFLLLVLYGSWQAAKWAKPRAEKFIDAAVSTMEQNANNLEKLTAETLPNSCRFKDGDRCRYPEG